MGLPAGTAVLKRGISISMEFASRTISPVPDISRYVSEDLFSSVSPRIFPGGNAGCASPVGSPQPVQKVLTPLPAHLHQKSLRLSTSATSQEAATPPDPHVTTRVHHTSVHREIEVDGIAAASAPADSSRSTTATFRLEPRGTRPANLAAPTITSGSPNDPDRGPGAGSP